MEKNELIRLYDKQANQYDKMRRRKKKPLIKSGVNNYSHSQREKFWKFLSGQVQTLSFIRRMLKL